MCETEGADCACETEGADCACETEGADCAARAFIRHTHCYWL